MYSYFSLIPSSIANGLGTNWSYLSFFVQNMMLRFSLALFHYGFTGVWDVRVGVPIRAWIRIRDINCLFVCLVRVSFSTLVWCDFRSPFYVSSYFLMCFYKTWEWHDSAHSIPTIQIFSIHNKTFFPEQCMNVFLNRFCVYSFKILKTFFFVEYVIK